MLQTFGALIMRDLAVFLPTYKDRIINSIIWAILTLLVFQYIMPSLGMSDNFGAFMAASNAASWGFFEVTENVSWFVADLEGDRAISYYLTLPIPQWLVFFRIGITNAIQALLVTIFFIPAAKIILGTALSFENTSWAKLAIIMILVHLFYGLFSLYLASKTKDMRNISNIWMRIVFPLWFIGCYQFPWSVLRDMAPTVARINLLNPIMYCMEGTRSALLGPEGSISFWWCAGALALFCIASGYIGIKKMKQRLDCI